MTKRKNNRLNYLTPSVGDAFYYIPNRKGSKKLTIDEKYWTLGSKYYIRSSGYFYSDIKMNEFGYYVTCDDYDGDDEDQLVFCPKSEFLNDFKPY